MEVSSTTRLDLERPIGDAVSRIRFSPASDNLLISSWDSVLRLYDVGNHVLRMESPSEGALLDCCFLDDSTAFSAASDCFIRRYDLCSGTQTAVGKHEDAPNCIEYSSETGQLISAGQDKKLLFWDTRIYAKLYDLRCLKQPLQKESSTDNKIRCVRSFSNCHGYAFGSIDGRVALDFFDQSKACEMGCMFRCHPKSKNGRHYLVSVNDIAFHPSCDIFITGDNEGYAVLWDAQSRKRLFEFPRYPNSVASLSYNHNGQLLAVASTFTYQELNENEEPPQIFISKTS